MILYTRYKNVWFFNINDWKGMKLELYRIEF